MKNALALVFIACISIAGTTLAEVLLSPADQIIGGVLTGQNFIQGTAGTAAGVNNWPDAEPPLELIDGSYGGAAAKYLNFAELNSGVIITPVAGATIVTSITLWTANDAVERDPLSYAIYGTNTVITNGGPGTNYPLANFTLISSGPVALPAGRNTVATPIGNPPYSSGFLQTITFANSSSYTTYLLVFPTVKDAAAANSMQVSEAAFEGQIGTGVPLVITDFTYDETTEMMTVTWRSEPGQFYALYYSPDLMDWGADINDSIPGQEGSETTTYGPFANPMPGEIDGYLRVEQLE